MGRISTEASAVKKYHDISDLKFEDDFLVVTIDGESKRYHLKGISPVLEKASMEERNNFEIIYVSVFLHFCRYGHPLKDM
jgi:hypothetical protein